MIEFILCCIALSFCLPQKRNPMSLEDVSTQSYRRLKNRRIHRQIEQMRFRENLRLYEARIQSDQIRWLMTCVERGFLDKTSEWKSIKE